ncbi:MAG: hypothetical protein K6D56_01575, partial [Clostridia bacterium]|nr:hypothetical protein [Clostridia bacterium]
MEKLIEILKADLAEAPTERLRISKSRAGATYYIRSSPSDRLGKYVRREDIPLAAAIAQRDYDAALRNVAGRELAAIQGLQQTWADGTVEELYDKLTPARRSLVVPRFVSDEEFVRQWLAEPYQRPGFKEGAPEFYSTKGLRVRSKSEALLADMYDSLGIPMKYECPLTLWNGRVLHPDFTLLNVLKRVVFIHEHFGLVDDPAYMNQVVRKINDLQLSGWYPGVNMIMTFETKDSPLDMRLARDL